MHEGIKGLIYASAIGLLVKLEHSLYESLLTKNEKLANILYSATNDIGKAYWTWTHTDATAWDPPLSTYANSAYDKLVQAAGISPEIAGSFTKDGSLFYDLKDLTGQIREAAFNQDPNIAILQMAITAGLISYPAFSLAKITKNYLTDRFSKFKSNRKKYISE